MEGVGLGVGLGVSKSSLMDRNAKYKKYQCRDYKWGYNSKENNATNVFKNKHIQGACLKRRLV